MFITHIRADGFKNLKQVDIETDKNLNILCGKNAQGKTNLIEALWLCSGVRSFRNTKDKRMIGIDCDMMSIDVSFQDSVRQQDIHYACMKSNLKEKNVTLNGVKLKAPSKLFGSLNCVVFTPEDLELSKGSPDNRRRFLDLSVAQIKNSYSPLIDKYEAIIDQRNTLLKNIAYGRSDRAELDIWDIQLAKLGAYISVLRYNYTKKLNIFASRLYNEISNGAERLDLFYGSTVYDDLDGRTDYNGELYEEYYRVLQDNLEDDIRMGFTQRGIHRDDLGGKINGLFVRDFASQGQHRSIALVMKLAQAYILAEEIDDSPCILLDDVLSELDPSRQSFVVSKIHDMQVFITCCDRNFPFELNSGKLFIVENGRIREEKR
ncbi:MAG: DNA replication/repair protein RecF [Ruminococcus sp.]|nr:DNA replication/repair protein RecF [Ruminococcus sp.]